MAARPRGVGARDLPPNLYVNGKYFLYVNPVTGQRISVNRTRPEAVRLAKAANAKLMPLVADTELLEAITGEQAETVGRIITRFEEEYLPSRNLAASTLRETRIRLDRYKADIGRKLLRQIDVLAMAEYLDQFENNAYTKHRALWVQIFRFAVAKGLAEKNVAEMTLRKIEHEKVRERHTPEGVQQMLEAPTTPAWLRLAIRLALLTLQRREDLTSWLRSDVDLEANTIKVSPGKAQGYENPIHLEIEMGPDLRAVVTECLQSPIAGPHLIRYRPKRMTKQTRDAKEHWSAVTNDYLTKSFSKARDDAKAYDHIKNRAARPTLHELRALGAWMYEQQGYPVEYVQALMGHATEGMTKYYQKGHDGGEVEYRKVSAGLALK